MTKSACYDVKYGGQYLGGLLDPIITKLYAYPFCPQKKRLKKSIIPVPLGTIPNETCWVFSIKILT